MFIFTSNLAPVFCFLSSVYHIYIVPTTYTVSSFPSAFPRFYLCFIRLVYCYNAL